MKKAPKRRGPEAGSVQSANLTVRLPVSLLNRLNDRAAQDGIRLGALAREAFSFYLHLNPSKS
jgi:hypothetical protein